MNKRSYPRDRAFAMARRLGEELEAIVPTTWHADRIVTSDQVIAVAESLRIRVRRNETLPGDLHGLTLRVEGHPFIVIDRRVSRNSAEEALILAHELAHNALSHWQVPGLSSVRGYRGTMRELDEKLSIRYRQETELEADLFAMQMVIPDAYLDAIVERSIWIPTLQLAKQYGFTRGLLAARVEVYRGIYGYERSRRLFEKRLTDDLTRPDLDKWFMREFAGVDGLSRFLPSYADFRLNG